MNPEKQSKGSQKRKIKAAHERASIEAFLRAHYPEFHIETSPNPPDAIASNGTKRIWIEHTDNFPSKEAAKTTFNSLVDKEILIVTRALGGENGKILSSILNKLLNNSYKKAFDDHGPGILIVTVLDQFYSESTASQLAAELKDADALILKELSQGYIGDVYLELPAQISSRPEESRPHTFRHLVTLS